MKLNQHFLVAQQNLVVEGVDDFYIISELSNLFMKTGEGGLPDEVEISAAGGASEAVYLATYMIGQDLKTVVLFDSDQAGRDAKDKLVKKWITRYKNSDSSVVMLGEGIGQNVDCSIEDIFPEDYYLKMVEESHKEKMKKASVKKINPRGKGMICKRVSKECENLEIQFNKGSVAKFIRRDLSKKKDIGELAESTREKAKKLFETLNSHP